MLNQQTLIKLRDLRLPGMAAAYEEEQRQGNVGQMSFDDRFGLLVEKEWGHAAGAARPAALKPCAS